MSKSHLRTMCAIEARLEKLGLIDGPSYAPRTSNPAHKPFDGLAITSVWFDEATDFNPKLIERSSEVNLNHVLTLLQLNYTTCAIEFKPGGKKYTYKVSSDLAARLKPGDQVVVPACVAEAVVTVREIHAEPDIDVSAPYNFKWVICRVEREAYDDQVKREADALALFNRNRRKVAQEKALKELFGEGTTLEEVRALLNPKKAIE
jgi:hypothetical protein